MKTSFQKILIRWYHASDKPLPRWLDRACERDPALARERDAEAMLTQRFRQDARPAACEASPFLAGRVVRALKEPTRSSPSPLRAGLPWLVAAGAACALALVVSRWNFQEGGGDIQPGSNHPQIAATTTEPQAGSSLALTVQPATGLGKGGTWVNPLDQEIDHVIADARGALNFLATSFLPTGAMEKKSG